MRSKPWLRWRGKSGKSGKSVKSGSKKLFLTKKIKSSIIKSPILVEWFFMFLTLMSRDYEKKGRGSFI
jgi:hypothetical protein